MKRSSFPDALTATRKSGIDQLQGIAQAPPRGERSGVLELAVDASPSGIVVCDEIGTILLVNRRTEALFGYSAVDLVGTSIDVLVPEASRRTHATERARFWSKPHNGNQGPGRELFGRHRDGTMVPIEIGLTATEHNGRPLVVASVVDIGERLKERAATEERLAVERLISDLATRLMNAQPDRADEPIVDGLRQVVEVLAIDRSALWQFTPDGQDLIRTHAWVRPEYPPSPLHLSARALFPWMMSRICENEAVWTTDLDEVPDPIDRENLRRLDPKSYAAIPLTIEGRVVGAVSLTALRAERSWSPEVRERLTLMANVFSHALARLHDQSKLRSALSEVERLRLQLIRENAHLRQEVIALAGPRAIAAESPAAREVLEQIESVAGTNATVLLLGETGSGKEVFAQAIHDYSKRRNRPMVRVNCAAIPAALIESELFGRERGAYTGALSQQIGRFELAHGSTLFLDEIGELPLESQVKLLRVVQDRVLERLGSVRPINVDVRLIAATNRDLERAVAERSFREDLYYRLNVFPIRVPPLRDRPEDIPVLVWTFVEEFAKSFGKNIESVSRDSLAALQEYSWPGNVRELRNLIERAVIVARGPQLVIDVPAASDAARGLDTLTDVESEHIRSVLVKVGWRVRGPGGAAALLGMKPTTLDSRMAKLGIHRPTS